MDHPLAKESAAQEKISKPFAWGRSGPLLLLGTFAILLFKIAPFYWPLTSLVFLGYAATLLWKKSGLLLSLISLGCTSIALLRSHGEPFWTLTLAASFALPLWLVYLGDQDTQEISKAQEDKICDLELKHKKGESLVQETKAQLLAEKTRADKTATESTIALMQAKRLTEEADRARAALADQCRTLAQNSVDQKSKEADLEQLVAKLQSEIQELLPKPREETEEDLQREQLHCQFTLLREQFEEKSDALDQARKDLFRVENDYLTLQKMWEEKQYEASDIEQAYIRDLKQMEELRLEMEQQNLHLQDVISSLLEPKKTKTRKKSN